MTRVSDASRTGTERGRSAPSPLAREGGLSKLMRSAGGMKGLSVSFVSSKSKSAFMNPASGVSKSYVSNAAVRRSLEAGASRLAGMVVMGKGTPATREAGC